MKFNSLLICKAFVKLVVFTSVMFAILSFQAPIVSFLEGESLFLSKYVLVETAAYLKEGQGWILSSFSVLDGKKQIHTR